jgi:SAM-dependent methyltransferase
VFNSRKIHIPDWYIKAWLPSSESAPDTLRKNVMHQAFSIDFYQEIPKNFVSILDVGCSDGWMCKHFIDDGKAAIGINDFLYVTDHEFIKNNKLDIRIMDMHQLKFKDKSFDAIWLRHTLEHSIAPLIVLSECQRILKLGGYIFIALPPYPDPPEYYPGHYSLIPMFQLEYFMKIYRFEIISLYKKVLSWERTGDNLEIRCVARKTSFPPSELHKA